MWFAQVVRQDLGVGPVGPIKVHGRRWLTKQQLREFSKCGDEMHMRGRLMFKERLILQIVNKFFSFLKSGEENLRHSGL